MSGWPKDAAAASPSVGPSRNARNRRAEPRAPVVAGNASRRRAVVPPESPGVSRAVVADITGNRSFPAEPTARRRELGMVRRA